MMQSWFRDARLGIFLHWGIYAETSEDASWPFFNGQETYAGYMAKQASFTAARYDPDAWADLFVRAGARYAVLTAKHHDGVALWDTAQSALSVVRQTPAKRDLVAPYVAALRRRGLKVGLYFSHLDWSHPDYASVIKRGGHIVETHTGYRFAYPPAGKEDPERWERFLRFHRAQLKELCDHFAPDLLWFDGDWERDEAQWRFAELRGLLQTWCPQAILNSRMHEQGDYATPEQGVPVVAPPGPWEFCVTMNDAWGYNPRAGKVKTERQLVRMLAECAAGGGNLLLNVGPKLDGTIPAEFVARLEGLGRFAAAHAEALYDVERGLPPGHLYGASTLSRDRTVLYAFYFTPPTPDVALKGIRNKIRRVTVLGHAAALPVEVIGGAPWANVPGVAWVSVPEELVNPNATVLKIELEGPLDLFRGGGTAVQQN